MNLKHFAFLLLLFACAYKPFHVAAQQCQIVPTTITTMNEPELGAYNLWDHVFGKYPDDESFIDSYKQGKDLLAVAYGQDNKPDQQRRIILSKLDHRGRQMWHTDYVIPDLLGVQAMLPHQDGALVLATVAQQDKDGVYQKAKIWMGVFDSDDGHLIRSSTLKDDGVIAVGAIAEPTKTGYIIAGQYVGAREPTHPILYFVDKNGTVKKRRAFRSGMQNRVHTVFAGKGFRIFVGGGATDFEKRKVGWAMALDYNLNLLWEKTLPRGAGASLTVGSGLSEDQVVFAGWSDPLGEQGRAAWITMLEAAGGEPVWERFYNGQRPYEAGAVLNNGTGTLSFVINGQAHPEFGLTDLDDPMHQIYKPFVRLLTLDERGNIVFAEDYTNAEGAQVSKMLLGDNNQRVLMGVTHSPDLLLTAQNEKAGQMQKHYLSDNVWAVAIPSPSLYEDPCKAP